jgi:high affinity sulfate transporter 1
MRGYQRRWWRFDVIAGLTVTAILIPEGMAYAQLAGVDPQAAFYAAPVALLLYALLGSSRQLVVAVSSAVAITSAATISDLAPQGTAQYVALTAALALLAGVISVAAGLMRLGRIARLFSSSVLLGFVFGLALVITVKQIPKLLGIEVDEQSFFGALWEIVRELPETSVPTLIVGLASVAAMVVLQRFLPRLPAALLVLVGSILASAGLDLSAHGVAVVGPLPAGLAPPQLPGVGWDAVPMLMTGALGIALLAFAEAMGPAEQLASKHGYQVDANRELVAIGAANAGAGLFQGFPIGASLSKSAANDRVGARSPMSLVVAAAATALVALFLTPLFQDLPEAALGAIVIVAVSDMERIGPLRRLWRIRRADCVLALVALLGVLVLGILAGLAVAVGLSLAVIVWRAGEGRLQLIGSRHHETSDDGDDDPVSPPGLLVARPLQMLFFVNAAEIREAVQAAVTAAEQHPDVMLLDLGLTPDLDVPALDTLTELRGNLRAAACRLWLVTGIDEVRDRLNRAGVSDPAVHVFNDISGGVRAYLSLHSTGPDTARGAALTDVLGYLQQRRDDPDLDERARVVLDDIEHRIRRELDDK